MATSVTTTGITFPDATTQTTAASTGTPDLSAGASSSGTTSTPPVGALFNCHLYNSVASTSTTYAWFNGGYGDTEAASTYKRLIIRYYGYWVSSDPSYYVMGGAITITSGTYQFLGGTQPTTYYTDYYQGGSSLIVRTA